MIFIDTVNEIENMVVSRQPLAPFDEKSLAFIDALSRGILKEKNAGAELIALAFWMRRSNIRKLKEAFETMRQESLLFARGVAFHIAPSNVDTIFVYSWF